MSQTPGGWARKVAVTLGACAALAATSARAQTTGGEPRGGTTGPSASPAGATPTGGAPTASGAEAPAAGGAAPGATAPIVDQAQGEAPTIGDRGNTLVQEDIEPSI